MGLDTSANGRWQFELAGQGWHNIHNVSQAKATLLPTDALLRFVPNGGWSGTATLTFRAWDQTTGQPGKTGVDTTNNGGNSAFSTTLASVTVDVTQPVFPPELTANNGLLAKATGASPITPSLLHAREAHLSADQLTFTVIALPQQGTLLVGNQPAASGSTFSQSDIDAGRLAYVPAASQATDDSFAFVVTDSSGTSLPQTVFHIQVSTNPPMLPPPLVLPPPVPPGVAPKAPVNFAPLSIRHLPRAWRGVRHLQRWSR